MKYKDINWESLLDGPSPEELDEDNKAFMESWREMFGDTSGLYPNDFNERQGGGEGIYVANESNINRLQKVRSLVERVNAANNGIIKSQPLDPSGMSTYIKSVAPYYIISRAEDIAEIVRMSGGISFNSFFGRGESTITWYVYTGKLYEKVESAEQAAAKQAIKDDMGDLLAGLYPERDTEYEPLDYASADQIFFNDTGLDFEPDQYDLDKTRSIARIKDFFDYLTDKDYENDDDPEAGRGGVTDIVYDAGMNAAGFRCLINTLTIYPDGADMSADDCCYSEIVPLITRMDRIAVTPGCHTHFKSFIWLTFAVGNIAKQ